tara:strand:+ start:120 stop:1217 length:1098 start_codon:yes stop_codon:yes gene_type:complete
MAATSKGAPSAVVIDKGRGPGPPTESSSLVPKKGDEPAEVQHHSRSVAVARVARTESHFAKVTVPTPFVAVPNASSVLINTSAPLPAPAERYWRALLARVGGRFPPKRTQALCNPGQNKSATPYVMILGAGNSGTGGIASLLTKFGLPLSHEHVTPSSIQRSGLVSWISTVLGAGTFRAGRTDLEPRCRSLLLCMQVRHPRSVVRSVSSWKFDYRLKGWDWVPEAHAAVWSNISQGHKALLWWSSFCLLAEAQLGADGLPGLAWRMEDVFHAHNAMPVEALLRVAGRTPPPREQLERSLAALNPYNSHVHTASSSLEAWDDFAVAAGSAADVAVRRAEVDAVEVARSLAIRYGYTTRRRRRRRLR